MEIDHGIISMVILYLSLIQNDSCKLLEYYMHKVLFNHPKDYAWQGTVLNKLHDQLNLTLTASTGL